MKTLRNQLGYERIHADGRTVSETDFAMCGHCQATVDLTPGKSVTDAGAYCSSCGTVVCPRCAQASARSGTCEPWEKVMDREDKAKELLRRWGLGDSPPGRLILPN